MVGHFLNVTCLLNDNSLSVTFVNNKAFGCSILYVRFGNSVRDNFRVICLWLDVLPDLSVHVL